MIIKFINKKVQPTYLKILEKLLFHSDKQFMVFKLPSQDKHAYRLANVAFDEVIGIYYGKTYLGDEAKADVISMIKKMLKVYEQRIQENTWLFRAY